MGIHVVRHRLEAVEQLFRLVDNALVAQHRAVVRDINGGGLVGVVLLQPLCLGVVFSECLQSGDGF